MYSEISTDIIEKSYETAKKRYSEFGIHTDEVLNKLVSIPISINCWQGDDVTGFEGQEGITGGGILATGNFPGRAGNADELKADFEFALRLIPGKHRFNLHSIYAETGGKAIQRDELSIEHFAGWIGWAKKNRLGLDFNPTFFSHPLADKGYTLASKDKKTRDFWIRHGKICREIAEGMGRELGTSCINNLWIPDGSKDFPADRLEHRKILKSSLDAIYKKPIDEKYMIDSVESKLFGIGSEAYVVGSSEFYLAYAVSTGIMLTLDAGHFHPTEDVSDKVSAILPFVNRLLLHVSRPMRWDSDHVVILDDSTRSIAREVKRAQAFDRVYFALDFFDASINRITAWVVGARSSIKALLQALLEPTQLLADEEERGNLGNRLALMEEIKALPFGSVWEKYCILNNVPSGPSWLNSIAGYEEEVLLKR